MNEDEPADLETKTLVIRRRKCQECGKPLGSTLGTCHECGGESIRAGYDTDDDGNVIYENQL